MSVGRLDLDLSSSDVTWNRPPNDPSLFHVSEDSKEEDGDDEQDEEDERLQYLCFFLRALYLLGEGEDFSVNEDEEVLLWQRLFFECLFLFDLFAFLCLVALLPFSRFPETPPGVFPVPTSP